MPFVMNFEVLELLLPVNWNTQFWSLSELGL